MCKTTVHIPLDDSVNVGNAKIKAICNRSKTACRNCSFTCLNFCKEIYTLLVAEYILPL